MSKIQGFILYKIYYETVMYLGRTKQPLQDRIRGHLFNKPMCRCIDINKVSKIEYAEFKTEADMNLYEIYYINKLKPLLNVDDKTPDKLTVSLPSRKFKVFTTHLWDKWKKELNSKRTQFEKDKDRYYHQTVDEIVLIRDKKRMGKISEDEYYVQMDKLNKERESLKKKIYKSYK